MVEKRYVYYDDGGLEGPIAIHGASETMFAEATEPSMMSSAWTHIY